MAVLVTGATGFIGAELVRALVQDRESVVAVRRRGAPVGAAPGLTWVEADLGTFEGWPGLLQGIDTVYHFAWSTIPQTANADPASDAQTNVVGTLRLLEALKERPGTRFVFASSGGTVYGRLATIPVPEEHPTRPITAYGASKLAIESYLALWAELWGLDPVSLRLANPFGPGQSPDRQFGAVSTFSAAALAGEPLTIYGDGTTVRDYLFVSDAVRAIIAAGRATGGSRAINVGTGRGRSLNEILAAIEGQLRRPLNVSHVPGRAFDVPVSILDVRRAERELGWRAEVSFEDGVARTIEGLRRRTRAGT